jgi:peroxiredoxin
MVKRKRQEVKREGAEISPCGGAAEDYCGKSDTFINPQLEHFMALARGTKAPAFSLKTKTADGLKDVALADTAGKKQTVLLFFPLAFTSVCTAEMCSVSQGLDAYQGLNAAVYAISVDSPFAQEAWAKANGITIPVLSDFNKDVAKAYDVLYPDLLGFKGVAKRSAFVIGQDGVIKYSSSSDDPKVLPDFAAIQAALKA